MKTFDQAFAKKYESYVEHPRYGRHPRHTGLNPNPYDSSVHLHWNASNMREIRKQTERILGRKLGFLRMIEATEPADLPRIAGTAIKANPTRQNSPTVPVSHYYDVDTECRGCHSRFIFFAEEQKHWYEVLRFPLHSGCVRCPECRKKEQYLARCRATYEKLTAVVDRKWKDSVKMADCALPLIEHGVYNRRLTERLRALLKSVPPSERDSDQYHQITTRLRAIVPSPSKS